MLDILGFSEKKRKEVVSLLGTGAKLKGELVSALFIYALIVILWHFAFTSWRVEWTWRLIQLAFPFLMTLIPGRSLKSLGIEFKNLVDKVKPGVILGLLVAGSLGIALIIWAPPRMTEEFTTGTEAAYMFSLILINVAAIEAFFRGFIQPRFEIMTSSIPGVVIVSVLSGMDFWEAWLFNSPIFTIGVAMVFGLLYLKTRSIITTIVAHVVILTSLMGMMAI